MSKSTRRITSEKPRKRPPSSTTRKTPEMLYGINPVEAALASGNRMLHQLFLKEGHRSERLRSLSASANLAGLTLSPLPGLELEKLCGSPNHQGVVLSCGLLNTRDEKSCLALARKDPPRKDPPTTRNEMPLLVALDEIQDPGNFGAIVRSCAVFGAQGVVLPRRHASPLSPAASKASAGFLESFPIYIVANLARFLDSSRKRGFWVAGATEKGNIKLNTFQHEQPLVLVMGSEGSGLRPLVSKQCDYHLAIPTAGTGNLNVSAAAAVLLYQLTSQPRNNIPPKKTGL